jgi:hypothetical protein
MDDARARFSPVIGEVRGRIAPALDDARSRVVPALDDARGRLTPALEETRDRIGPALEDARHKLVPVAQQAVSSGKRQGRKAAVRLGLAEEPKKRHKLRKLLLLLGIGGAGFFAYKKLFGTQDSWTDAGTTSASASSAGQVPGSAPRHEQSGEHAPSAPTAPLASEETVESPQPTTPDHPLEEERIDSSTPPE